MNLANYITPTEAAKILGVTPGRARQLTQPSRSECLPGVIRFGNQAMIPRKEIEKLAKRPPKCGRPRKFLPQKTSGK